MNPLRNLGRLLVLVVAAVLSQSCSKPPPEAVSVALSATNLFFQCPSEAPIILTGRQADTLKSIVAGFRDPKRVRTTSDRPYPPAFFVCDSVRFAWLGGELALRDTNKQRYYLVQDQRLWRLWDAYTNYTWQGQLPLHTLSREEWQKALNTLNDEG